MTQSSHDDGPGAAEIHAEAYAALLRRERQIDVMQHSLGWRLLSHYGPYKRRFVLPAWRRLRKSVARFMRRADESDLGAYEHWARFADRFRGVSGVPGDCRELVSLVMTVGGHTRATCERAIGALSTQGHEHWELLLAAVHDSGPAVMPPACEDARIHVDAVGYADHASALTALVSRAAGSITAILPPDALLASDALAVAVRAFRDTDADVLYSDEDHVDDAGRRHGPRFLPGWSPDLLLSTMYWSRVVFHRREVLARLLPLAPDLEDALSYDLALRVTEQPVKIVHVPRVLAHVVSPASAPEHRSGDAAGAQRRALEHAVARRGLGARVRAVGADAYRVQRPITAPAKVSIVIPTRDGVRMLRRCLAAIERTQHSDFEVIIVDNGSRDEATLEFLAASRHRVLRAPGPFNFSRLNNVAVREATGRYVLFLNDDTEPSDPTWLTALEEHAQRVEVGAVGAKLLYADGRIQHAGIAVGIGGIAGHPGRFGRDGPDVVRNVSAVTAACLMMRRETFDAIGGFDEALPVNSNDVDMCLRLRARGYLVVYTPHAVVRHYESQTRGARAIADDAWLMQRRWRDVLRSDPYYSPNLELQVETGDPDLSKPDGLVCLYPGPTHADGAVELGAGRQAGQRFFATGPDLAAIVLRATIVGPAPERALRLGIREDPDATVPLRVVDTSIPGQSPDERWFCFEPIERSGDRFLYFTVEAAADHVASIRRQNVTSDVMGPCSENGRPAFGTLQFQLYARAPYRCAIS